MHGRSQLVALELGGAEIIALGLFADEAYNQTDGNADQRKRDVLWTQNQCADNVGDTANHCSVEWAEGCCCEEGTDGIQVKWQLQAGADKAQNHVQRNTDSAKCQHLGLVVLHKRSHLS